MDHLGSGQFGTVHRGTWKSPNGDTVEVAVKTLVAKEKVVSRVKLLQEAAIMGQFLHPNVIQLIGVITKKDTVRDSVSCQICMIVHKYGHSSFTVDACD